MIKSKNGRFRHPLYKTPTYASWKAMKQRCFREADPYFPNYGGRGISVHPKWMTFDGFVADMGERPEGTTLDRIDLNGNYEPGNCRWATITQQNRNRSDTHWVELNGERKSLAEWCELRGLSPKMVLLRVKRFGWSYSEALNTPNLGRGYSRNRRKQRHGSPCPQWSAA